ncbi:MAG: YigZ family protein [Eubacterium sp.]|nr:YigZ family protein [Eubacterium sp.]
MSENVDIESDEKILKTGASAQYVEKRSKFIAQIVPVSSEQDALAEIDRIKKQYYDARHNCYAYVVYDEKGEAISRSSDDGEPSGTAGKPMLEILTGNKINNILVVVTRYFGGTLLGTGGLVRAYSTSVKDALAKCELSAISEGQKLKLRIDYTGLAQVQNLMRKMNVLELESAYENDVNLVLISPIDVVDKFKKELAELFSGRDVTEELDKVRYGISGQEIFVL